MATRHHPFRISPRARRTRAAVLLSACALALAGCGSSGAPDGAAATVPGIVDASLFDPAGLAAPVTEEDCTLSSGKIATCLRIQLKGAPADHDVGPFCPRTVTDPTGGIWFKDGSLYDLDGPFVKGLSSLYDDPAWKLYDETTGAVRVTDTRESCLAAARPDVDPAYENYCVECSLDDVGDGGGIVRTLLIPRRPEPRATPAAVAGVSAVGAAFNGVAFDLPAPVGAIIAHHTIAALDDCGGHVNFVVGYHYHAATGCSREIGTGDGHAAQIGYAIDGHAMHATADAHGAPPTDLDACLGHRDAVRGYHYHVAGPGENRFIGCLQGEIASGGGGEGLPPGGGGSTPCAAGQTSACCGDGTCDGPESAADCAADCR
ncbi:YHYH protein [bacterium]|nr:YHYH protein [bacterium]